MGIENQMKLTNANTRQQSSHELFLPGGDAGKKCILINEIR